MRSSGWLGVALAALLLTAACSAATHTPAVDVSGHWTAQVIESYWGLHLNQEGERLTGTAVRSGTAPFSVYEVLGMVRGGALHVELRSLYPAARPEHWRLMGWAANCWICPTWTLRPGSRRTWTWTGRW